jgi:hypothetical protein
MWCFHATYHGNKKRTIFLCGHWHKMHLNFISNWKTNQNGNTGNVVMFIINFNCAQFTARYVLLLWLELWIGFGFENLCHGRCIMYLNNFSSFLELFIAYRLSFHMGHKKYLIFMKPCVRSEFPLKMSLFKMSCIFHPLRFMIEISLMTSSNQRYKISYVLCWITHVFTNCFHFVLLGDLPIYLSSFFIILQKKKNA